KKVSLLEQSQIEEITKLKRHSEEATSLLQKQLDQIKEEHVQELAKLAEEAELEKKLAIVQLKRRFETELAKQKVDYETLAKNYDDHKQKAELTETQLRHELATSTQSYDEQLSALQAQTEALTEQLQQLSAAKDADANGFEQRLLHADSQLLEALELEQQLKQNITELETALADVKAHNLEQKDSYELTIETMQVDYKRVSEQLAQTQIELEQLKG